MAIRYERLGDAPRYRDILIADTEAELLASVPPVEIAEGYAKDTGTKADWVREIGWKVGGATRLPDGSAYFDGGLGAQFFAISKIIPGLDTLESVLSGPIPPQGVRVLLSDVPDADIVSSGTKWMGFFGTLTAEQFTDMQAYNAKIAVRSWCRVPNPAVASGLSHLERGTLMPWAPPKGEPIAQKWRTASAPLASIVPGAIALSEIWGAGGELSPVIPDYMIPDGIVLRVAGQVRALNAPGVAGCVLGITISGSTPTGVAAYNYPLATSVTPNSGAIGTDIRGSGLLMRSASDFKCGDGQYFSGGYLTSNQSGVFVPGSNRVYVMAKPSKVDDEIRLEGYSIVSEWAS